MSELAFKSDERVQPSNIELEQELLGAILLRAGSYERIASFLHPEHFFNPIHQHLMGYCASIFEANRPVTAMTVASFVSDDEAASWEDIGGRAYIARLTTLAASPEYIVDHARQVIEYWKRRELMATIDEVYPTIPNLSVPFEGISDFLEEASAGLRQEGGRKRTSMFIGEAVRQVMDHIDTPGVDRNALNGLSTGLKDLDAKLGGMAPGDMVILAGRPSMGKSTLALNIGRSVATSGAGVLYISPEMTAREFGFRILSDDCFTDGERIEYSSIRRRWLDDRQKAMLRAAAARADQWPLMIEEAGDITVAGIRSLAKRAQRQFERDGTPLGLIVVDHIGMVQVPKIERGYERITYISGQMKALAKNFGVPVLALSQLSRQVESRDDKRPQLSDLRESGAIEQDADVVLFPYRHQYYLERSKPETFKTVDAEADWQKAFSEHFNKADILIAKNRNGPIGSVKVFCDVAVNAFRDLQRQEELL